MSWRETTPQPVQDDLDALLDVALDAAGTMLGKHAELLPFAVTLDAGGEKALTAAPPDDEGTEAAVERLRAALTADRERLRCVGVVVTVVAEGIGDAVMAQLEHRDGGPAIAVLQPYKRRRLRRGVEVGELVAMPGERAVWA
jgi:hypothetical protein